jgi:hypothetical protein
MLSNGGSLETIFAYANAHAMFSRGCDAAPHFSRHFRRLDLHGHRLRTT